jgi:predicted histidine transporter YuiF (NhaC family)
MPRHESLFGLFGGPLAWYVQLNTGFALASQPCFRDGIHLATPIAPLQWTMPAMVLTTLGAFVVALLALLVSWRGLGRAAMQAAGETQQPIDASAGRARFLALWGVLLGASFASATALTGAIFIALPRCAG